MNRGRTLFAQLIEYAPQHPFRLCVRRYRGDYRLRIFSCWDQFLCLLFAQWTGRESLRDIVACLGSHACELYHMGTAESRLANIKGEIAHVLNLNYGVEVSGQPVDADTLDNAASLGMLTGGDLPRLARSIHHRFPFYPESSVLQQALVGDLVHDLVRKVGY